VLILMCVPVLVASLGLVVDTAGKLGLENQVQWTAEQAARAAGQQIQGPTAQHARGEVLVDVDSAVAAARQVVSSSGMTGTVQVVGGQVEVTVTARYEAKILPVSGDVTGHSTARTAHGVGVENG
jgi:Flp pilus assembly protein TadG